MSSLRTGLLSALALAAFIAAACNGSTPLTPTAAVPPAATPAPPATGNPGGNTGGGAPPTVTITITAAGVDPKNVTVARGGTVVFMNADSVAHFPASNPHPVHTDCPDINVGSLAPGQSGPTQALNTVRTCGFHDHNNPQNDALKGSITIQ